MVNSIMRVTGDETLTMSRSFLMKKYNYSHCPLKKRPIQFIKEEKFDDKGELGKILFPKRSRVGQFRVCE